MRRSRITRLPYGDRNASSGGSPGCGAGCCIAIARAAACFSRRRRRGVRLSAITVRRRMRGIMAASRAIPTIVFALRVIGSEPTEPSARDRQIDDADPVGSAGMENFERERLIPPVVIADEVLIRFVERDGDAVMALAERDRAHREFADICLLYTSPSPRD